MAIIRQHRRLRIGLIKVKVFQSIWDQDGQDGAARSSQSTRVAVGGEWLAGRSQLGVKLAQMSR